MGTSASTVSGAISELEIEIDTLNAHVEPAQSLVGFISTTLTDAINELRDSVGTLASLSTVSQNAFAAINELDAELGTITSVAMGTTASTVSGAILELEQEIDTLNDSMGSGGLNTTGQNGFNSGDKLTFRVTQIGSDPTFGFGVRFMLKCRV